MIESLPVGAIQVGEGRRVLRGVDELAASMADIGQLQAIGVTANGQLVYGNHRLMAAKQLGWDTIRAEIIDTDDPDDLEIMEIQENLRRNELNVVERGEAFIRLEAALDRKGRRIKAGDNQHTTGPLTVSGAKTTEALALELGMSGSGYRQHKQIATKIEPVVRDIIRDLPVASHTRDLLEIARARPAEQHAIAAVLERGNVESVREAKQVIREQGRAERDAALPSPPLVTESGPFDVLYVDPPWRYEHVETENRAIENHYPTMDLPALCAFDLAPILPEDCVLFLWATSPKLAEAITLINAWGFNYRTCAVWVKDKIGMGYYFRQRHELLLVATMGTPGAPAPPDRADSVITAPRLEHSAKPEQVYGLIEVMYPRARKAELFAREQRPGWIAWGNQA